MSRTCPRCFTADEVTQHRGIDGLWTFTCDYTSKHADRLPHTWDATNDAEGSEAEVRRSLTPYLDPLRACVQAGEPFVEYGIVEWRFRHRAARLFDELVAEHGHTQLNVIPSTKTASAYLAQSLGLLAADGDLVRITGTATGMWSYNGSVTYWAVPPGPATSKRLTWKAYAEEHRLDANDITAGWVGGSGYRRGVALPGVPVGHYVEIRGGKGVYHHPDCYNVTGDWQGADTATLGERVVHSPLDIRERGLRPAQCCNPPALG